MTAQLAPPRITGPSTLTLAHVEMSGERKQKMVGMVVAHPSRGLVFFHAHSGTQPYVDRKTNIGYPAPLDVAVIAACGVAGVTAVYVYDRMRFQMRRTDLDLIAGCVIREMGNRARYLVPREKWELREDVREIRRGAKLQYVQSGTDLLFTAPNARDLPTVDLSVIGF